MSNIDYTDAPAETARGLDEAEVIADFLPAPEELVRKSEKERITIAVDKHSLELFRGYAKRHNAKYQTMMNNVLGSYAERYLKRK